MFRDQSIGFIGGGNMGEALIRGLIAASLFPAEKIFAYDVIASRIQYLEKEFGIKGRGSIGELAESSSIIVLAVKPQVISQVLDTLRAHLSHKPLVISIAAGIALSTLEGRLPDETSVVRVMPNTPALVQKGASALSRGKAVSAAQMEMSLALFRAVGKAVEVEEKLMDAVTGLSGSGPAYILLVIEALIDAGVFMGLPRQTARRQLAARRRRGGQLGVENHRTAGLHRQRRATDDRPCTDDVAGDRDRSSVSFWTSLANVSVPNRLARLPPSPM